MNFIVSIFRLQKAVLMLLLGVSLPAISNAADPAPMETLSSPPGVQRDVSLDNGGVLRLAADSAVGKIGTKDFELLRGAVLIDDASGFGKRGTRLQTQESKLTVRGGTLIAEYQKGSHLKLICVSGEVTIASKSLFKEFIQLKAGQMLVANPAEKFLPEPVPVDLERLIASSPLLGHSSKGLANAGKVDTATQKQRRAVQKGDATKSPLVMAGRGTAVGFDAAFAAGSPAFQQVVAAAELAQNPPVVASPPTVRPPPVTPPVNPPVIPPVVPPVNPPVVPPVTPPVTPPITSYTAVNNSTVFDFISDPNSLTTPGFAPIIRAGDGTLGSIQYFRSPYFTFNGTFDFSAFNGEIKFLSTENDTLFGNLSETNILLGVGGTEAAFWSDSDFGQSIRNTTFTVATGSNYDVDFFSFAGNIDVSDSYFTANDFKIQASQNLTITNVTIDTNDPESITTKEINLNAGEGEIAALTASNLKIGKTEAPRIARLTSAGQISITNSSQLKALAAMSITSTGGNVNIANTLIEVMNDGGSLNVTSKTGMDITSSTLSAHNVRLEVVGVDGVLHIKGSTITATQALGLYANSTSGTILFSGGEVNLEGSSINIGAHTVEIQSGTTVKNLGVTNIDAVNHRYGITGNPKDGYGSFSNTVNMPVP